jgi:type IV pilus assembly protein PilB
MGVEPFLLVSTVRAIIGQRLVRRLCEEKDAYQLPLAERAKVASEDAFNVALSGLKEEQLVQNDVSLDQLTYYHPKPSVECDDGYRSRIGIHEVLTVSPAVREIILKNSTTDAIEAQAHKEGMLTMLEDGLYKAARGITSVEEVLRAVSE